MAASNKTLTFKVTRKSPELIPPAKPTPHEFKPLSDIDDQEVLRFQMPVIQFYPKNPSMEGKDPAEVIRAAIAKALVFYYPFAGQLREYAGRKLVVECTGEGVIFIEADADVALRQFGDTPHPPFPCLEELLYDVPGSGGVINCPLLLIQVTRLKCGGFIFALRFNHTMCDGTGIVQFMSSVGELSRGAESPSIPPVWERHLLNARDPPHVSFAHHEYDIVPNTKGTLAPIDDMVYRSFFFGPAEISTLRSCLHPHFRRCTTFELLTACIWRCRTIAISLDPDEVVRVICIVNSRTLFNPPLPEGYYDNVLASPVAISTAEELSKNPLHYALELIRKTKSKVTEEYMKSVADLMVSRGRPNLAVARTYLVSSLMHMGFEEVDFGWGKPVYGGVAKADNTVIRDLECYYVPLKNNKGENGIVVPICLRPKAMEVFAKELEMMVTARNSSIFIQSTL